MNNKQTIFDARYSISIECRNSDFVNIGFVNKVYHWSNKSVIELLGKVTNKDKCFLFRCSL